MNETDKRNVCCLAWTKANPDWASYFDKQLTAPLPPLHLTLPGMQNWLKFNFISISIVAESCVVNVLL